MKRLLSLVAVIVLVLAMVPATVFAADTVVAKVGTTEYTNLQTAIDAADGKQITMVADAELTATAVVAAGKAVTLELNGKKISGVSSAAAASAVIENKGSLTIQDSVGGGKITSQALNPDKDWGGEGEKQYPTYANNTIKNSGILKLTSGTIEQATEYAGATYAIDNYNNGEVTIDGGKVIHVGGVAIREFANSTTAKNAVTVNGGEVKGKSRAVWIHLPSTDSTKAPLASLVVNGGTLTSEDTEYNLAVYVYSYGNSAAQTVVKINGGTINGNVAINGNACKTIAKGNLAVTGGTVNGADGVFGYGDIAEPFITGGKFKNAPDAAYLAEGYTADVKVGGYHLVHQHKFTDVAAKAATYFEDGNIAYKECGICGLMLDQDGKVLTNVTIPMLIPVKDETASVDEAAVDNAVESAKAENKVNVTIDVTVDEMADEEGKPVEVNKAKLPVASVEKVADLDDKATLTVSLTDATVTMDKKALDTVAETAKAANTETVTLDVKEMAVKDLTDDQQKTLKGEKVAAVINASLLVNNKEVHDFKGGKVAISISFTPEKGTKGSDYAVYYVADDGSVEKVPASYRDGVLTMTVSHFSDYVVVNTAAETPKTGDAFRPAVMIAIMLASAAAVVFLQIKKRTV